ncbi:tripartite tricarboxylate transporter substrate binding protein [Pseudorhodoplanes sp.]|uniref:Bug family tripartite tricarboxylate transporter substrate binding protein n=1 Tax=Pseudorhodoplanes sp. TaxID=1934341 RepID=UPI002C8C47CB|nr:tripartite tricarboxylate transporter substrate binding protein [Pseudorhodoplanes sp.]HWV44174.1 tripartite tricarboxylate transporter substrate binding protein [Pseudorhodoplanes sp.]
MKAVFRAALAAALMLAANSGHAQSQNAAPGSDYPNRQVRILLPFPPGGVADVVGRMLAQKLSDSTGQNFFVENRPGAAGNIGAALVQSLPPDGYTILLTSSSFLINPGLQKVPYDAVGGFEPITIISASPSILAIHPGQPVNSVKDLIDMVKKAPGTHSYASAGVGSTPHLQGEMFKQAYGLDIVHVPFAGGGPALQSAVAGHTPIVFAALPPAIPLVKAGTLRALAIVGPKRVSALPDVPTMTEAGLPGQETETILLALAPAGTPKPIVDKLQQEIVKAVNTPEVVQKLDALGFSPLGTTPAEAAKRIKSELDLWAKVIKDAKIQQ